MSLFQVNTIIGELQYISRPLIFNVMKRDSYMATIKLLIPTYIPQLFYIFFRELSHFGN
jgi:hypothetical protein